VQWGERVGRHVFPLLNERQRAWAERTLADLLNDNVMTDYTPALTHSDLWAEHVLFDPEREELTGVIDFESARLADPAGDWVALWLDHEERTVEWLLAHYAGPANASLRHRMLRAANYVPFIEILCGVLYDDRASWRAGWARLGQMVG
jgi:aminoglycoside 2''-phosphotransferase